MKRIFFSLACAFLLTGCFGGGGEKDSEALPDSGTQFAIGDTTWRVALVQGWEQIENLPNPNTIYSAKKNTQNFLVHQYSGSGGDIAKYFYESADKAFFYYEGVSIQDNYITFKAQSRASSPLRTYHQKIEEVPGLPTYLIGSCSYESQDTPDDCEQILDLWTQLAPEKEK